MRTGTAGQQGVFYGWYVAGACFLIAFVLYGIGVNTFTVYVKPLEAEFGWSRASISMAITLAALAMGVAAPLVGRLLDRLGARRLMLGGAALVGGGWALLSTTPSLAAFYLIFLLVGVGQAAATLIPISMVISNWFTARRGLAMGLVMSGTGLGAMVMVPVTTWLVAAQGWRWTALAMGAVMLAVAVPLNLLFVHTRPADLGLHPDGHDGPADGRGADPVPGLPLAAALRTRTFWLIALLMFAYGLVGLGVGVHLMPYLQEIGHEPTRASFLISLVSAATVGGKLVVGGVADRFGVRAALVCMVGALVGGIVLLLFAHDVRLAIVCAIVYGFAIGSPLVVNPALVSTFLGLAHFGAIFGLLTLLSTVGAALGPYISGLVYDATGSYVPTYLGFIGLILVAGMSSLAVRCEYDAEPRPHLEPAALAEESAIASRCEYGTGG